MIDQQIKFFTRIIGSTLIIFGIISAIAQVIKLLMGYEDISAALMALGLSILLIIFGMPKIMSRIINLALRYRTVSKLIIFAFPLILSTIFILIRVSMGLEAWKKMNTEGGFIEYGTSLAFLLAAIFALPIGKFFMSQKQKFFGYLYYLITAGAFFIGMEEISWGQKLLGFESSEFFQNYNSQSEITLHNLIWINEYLDKGLMFVALIAAISWLVYQLISKNSYNYQAKFMIPRWFLSSFFMIVFIFFYLIEYIKTWNHSIATFQESIELIFSLGCLAFILSNFFATGELIRKPLKSTIANTSTADSIQNK